ncbi:MAG: TIGR02453 family protein [Cognatishimia sp.]|uniref:TIGR02453 family protein n=1 Tax=Cognatishimia sp. TaxID=2211648 RepID=UPI003B8C2847
MADPFHALIPDARAFLSELAQNNSRDWFLANKARYDSHLKRPAELLLDQISAELAKSLGAPVKPKLFRPHRDVRFSKDKTPYHQHLNMLWNADLGGVQPVGFFFGIGLDYLSIGGGFMGFEKDTLTSWRLTVDGPLGQDIADVTASLTQQGMRISEPELKRVPAPYDREHTRAELLRRKSMSAWRDFDQIEQPLSTLAEVFSDLKPLINMLGSLR